MSKLGVGEILNNASKGEEAEQDECVALSLARGEIADETSRTRAEKHEKKGNREVRGLKSERHRQPIDAKYTH